MLQGRFPVHVPCLHVGACVKQQLGNCRLIRMRGGMQRGCPPMIVVVLGIHIGARLQQELDNLFVAFPGGAMQSR